MATTPRMTSPRRPRWRSRWLAASVVVALLLGVDLLPARATPELGVSAALPAGYQSSEAIVPPMTLQPGERFGTTIPCPSGQFAIGGGASISIEPSGGGVPSLVSNGPSVLDRWEIQYVNVGDLPTTFGIRITTVCAGRLGSPQGGSATDPIAPNEYQSFSVGCTDPLRRTVIGGGVSTANTTNRFVLLENMAHGAGWAGLWVNLGSSSENPRGSIWAICVNQNDIPGTTLNRAAPGMQFATIAANGDEIKTLDCTGSPASSGINVYSVNPSGTPRLAVVEDGPIPGNAGQTRYRFRLRNFGSTTLQVQYQISALCFS